MARDFRIALMISIAMHIFFMSFVVILNPTAAEKIRTYTKVDFLGPILQKTAFDIMIENADPLINTSYTSLAGAPDSSYLKVSPASKITAGEITKNVYSNSGGEKKILDSLKDNKEIAD